MIGLLNLSVGRGPLSCLMACTYHMGVKILSVDQIDHHITPTYAIKISCEQSEMVMGQAL